MLALATALCIDMGGEYGIRNVVVTIASPMLMWLHARRLRIGLRVLFPFVMLIIWPLFSFAIGLANGADERLALSQLQSTVLGFVLVLIVGTTEPNRTARLLTIALRITAVAAISLAVGLFFDFPLAAATTAFLDDSGGGYFGKRSVTEFDFAPNIYFKSSIFYAWAFTYTLLLNQHRSALLLLFAMIAATSKASLLAALLITLIRTTALASIRTFLFAALATAAAVSLVMALSLDVLFVEIVKMESNTVDVRMLHLRSLLSYWAAHPLNIFFGFGLGTEFFSLGEGALVSNIELDHLNCIRKYGLFWSLAFFAWTLVSAWSAIRSNDLQRRATGWALLVVFIVAGTNPVLISPLFFLVLAICHAKSTDGVDHR
ncbi:MAG: hypothetical protein ACK5Y8_06110 [Betaproteobacteria bacterium]|jgi:hypothetical protein|nr:hypothetical protein [Rubrivivax sp.]